MAQHGCRCGTVLAKVYFTGKIGGSNPPTTCSHTSRLVPVGGAMVVQLILIPHFTGEDVGSTPAFAEDLVAGSLRPLFLKG